MRGLDIKKSKKIGCPVTVTVFVYMDNPAMARVVTRGCHNHPVGADAGGDELMCRNLDPKMRAYATYRSR
jgi:hypothetical protein